jgi:SP family sugar:H+ symporter-like MFS transporter
MVPETKGLSLEQIDLLYRNSSIRGSDVYRQKILDENLHETAHTTVTADDDTNKVTEKDSHTEDIKV